jgi:hypothetical protein
MRDGLGGVRASLDNGRGAEARGWDRDPSGKVDRSPQQIPTTGPTRFPGRRTAARTGPSAWVLICMAGILGSSAAVWSGEADPMTGAARPPEVTKGSGRIVDSQGRVTELVFAVTTAGWDAESYRRRMAEYEAKRAAFLAEEERYRRERLREADREAREAATGPVRPVPWVYEVGYGYGLPAGRSRTGKGQRQDRSVHPVVLPPPITPLYVPQNSPTRVTGRSAGGKAISSSSITPIYTPAR